MNLTDTEKDMKNQTIALAAVIAVGVAGWFYLRPGETTGSGGGAIVSVTTPASFSATAEMGRRAFEANCIACHGENATGLDGSGPPLVHKIYEPSHHGDEAFQVAVARGTRAHHWKFGNMPPVEGLTRADVTTIIAYVRELQRANGIQ